MAVLDLKKGRQEERLLCGNKPENASFAPRLSEGLGSYIGMADLTPFSRLATWRSGYAADCKSVYAGSIPAVASTGLR